MGNYQDDKIYKKEMGIIKGLSSKLKTLEVNSPQYRDIHRYYIKKYKALREYVKLKYGVEI